nr:UDP-galactopyranose mutase [uncultured Desulfobacter sp.]
MKQVDTLIVGAGITGITAASILAREKKKKVLVVEKRNHIGGNCYDCLDDHGILIHLYGPHIFHTRHRDVWEYLSQFTDWIEYVHRVKAYVNGKLISFPININTFEQLFNEPFDEQKVAAYLEREKINIPEIKNAEDAVISRMGRTIYDTFFKNYTKKQWGVSARELSPEVTQRIPIRMNRDERFFTDPYQGIPAKGYTAMFNRMLDHKNIEIITGKSFQDVKESLDYDQLIYTGPIDEYFDYKYGHLPYRGIRFEFKTLDKEFHQPVAVVNYPNDYKYTRITEFKHMTLQNHSKTSFCFEYPETGRAQKDAPVPSYPILNAKSLQQYTNYFNQSAKIKVIFMGRLGRFKYSNMDNCIKQAVDLFADKRI